MTKLTNHHNIDGLTLFTADPEPHLHDIHAHDAYSIIVLTSGRKQFHHCGTTTEVAAHEIAIANPRELHGCGPIANQPWSHRTWYISEDLMAEVALGLGLELGIRLISPVIKDQALAKALIHAHTQCDHGELLDNQTAVFEILEQLILNFSSVDAHPVCTPETPSIHRMAMYERWLEAHLGRTPELWELAELVGIQRNQVIRDFKQHKGVTPGVYLRQLRLNYAKRMIQSGGDLTTISLEAGYADQSHFSRSFKKAFGVTPKEFQNLSVKSGGKAPL